MAQDDLPEGTPETSFHLKDPQDLFSDFLQAFLSEHPSHARAVVEAQFFVFRSAHLSAVYFP